MNSRNDFINYYMQKALNQAQKALDKGELPIGAIVVFNNKIIAEAHTAEKAEKRRLVHAELLALEKADSMKPFPGKREEMKLFTTLEPCMMCLGAAMTFGLGEIYYALESTIDGATRFIHEFKLEETDRLGYNVPKIIGGIQREQSKELFEQFIARYSSGGLWKWARKLIQV